MSGAQDTLTAEVAALKNNMAALHDGVASINTRLTAALAAATANPAVDNAALADLHTINDDLASVVASLAPPAPAQSQPPA